MPRRILRLKEAYDRLACGHSKFHDDYRFHHASEPYVPGTEIARLKPIRLGPTNIGFVEHEVDRLIDALAKAGGHSKSKAQKRKPRPQAARAEA